MQNNWLSALLSESFASSDKAKFWNYEKNSNVRPEDVFKSCKKNTGLIAKIAVIVFNPDCLVSPIAMIGAASVQ
jgi:hypothetical protein